MTLKESLFNEQTMRKFSKSIKKVFNTFDENSFVSDAITSFPPLELKERMTSVRELLYTYLPKNYIEAISILDKARKEEKSGYFVWGSVFEYIEQYGCNDKYLQLSLQKLGEFSYLLSAEFSIRRFLNEYPKETLMKIAEWSLSDDEHKRRLASEGVRPKLPWSIGITVDYKEAAKSLDNLYYDKSRYVTRSVANHLNDISKIDPIFVLNTLDRWRKSKKQNKNEMKYIIGHSLRTLVKRGHKETLRFLGYSDNPNVTISNLTLKEDSINLDDYLYYSFDVEAHADANIVIDYILLFPGKTGKTNRKVFKLTSKNMIKGDKFNVSRKKQFRHLSTRTLNQGVHTIQIQLNGKVVLEKQFQLIIE